jgi:hypothetical protein
VVYNATKNVNTIVTLRGSGEEGERVDRARTAAGGVSYPG